MKLSAAKSTPPGKSMVPNRIGSFRRKRPGIRDRILLFAALSALPAALAFGDDFTFVQTSPTSGHLELHLGDSMSISQDLTGLWPGAVIGGGAYSPSWSILYQPDAANFGVFDGNNGVPYYGMLTWEDPGNPGMYNVLQMDYGGNGGGGFFNMYFEQEAPAVGISIDNGVNIPSPIYANGQAVQMPYRWENTVNEGEYGFQTGTMTVQFTDLVDVPESTSSFSLLILGVAALWLTRKSLRCSVR